MMFTAQRNYEVATQLRVRVEPQDWQAQVHEAYRQDAASHSLKLRADMAGRIATLIGSPISVDAIYVEPESRVATAKVDGVLFRQRGQNLVVVRPCSYCGTGRYESQPVTSQVELGYALSAWQPACEGCEPEDSADEYSW